ncbi:hypothetical protein LCGC14_0513330 [marine sediment metagenome]|uniref:Polysaccharide chain length determinant N-terminal domain-containing protein n=1 Tax=marine sediment metagenome TaxID=412755 RepID=A0A0F9V8Z7_9ZZZZ
MDEYEGRIEWMNYLNVIWKRKWLIIISTFLCALAAGVFSFLQPPVWEVDATIQAGKIFDKDRHEEVLIIEGEQLAGQINEGYFNNLIAAELSLDVMEMPKIKARNLRWTELVKVSIRANDVEKTKQILYSLFNHLKKDLDKKIDVEFIRIDTQISTNENLIKQTIIEKNKIPQEIISAKNKVKISEDRVNSIMEEMKAAKTRIDELEKQQRKALADKKQVSDAISLLLYSNEVQQNLRYYNTLDEKLSKEKITQEDLKLNLEGKKTEIEEINNEIDNIKDQIALLNEKKARVDYAQLIKKPTSSLGPVFPKKKRNVMITGILGLMIFTMLAFFLEYIEKQKPKS